MRRLFSILLTAWAGFVFVFTMLFIIPPLWLTDSWPEPRRTSVLIRLTRGWMAVFFLLAGIRLTIRGRERFAPGQNYIVVCNHNSMMDVPITSPGIPGANKTIAKAEMARIPVFGIIYRRGSVLVDRKSDQSRRESFARMRDVLETGMHMCIYPEGTRNTTGKPLKEFHEGAFRLALDTKKPIMPAVIFGTAKMLPSDRSWSFRPGRLEMHFLEPIEVSSEDTSQTLKEKVFRAMWDHYLDNRPEGL
jgi:1-acyl-sn-glycerol-3-phosphate acyltransferase